MNPCKMAYYGIQCGIAGCCAPYITETQPPAERCAMSNGTLSTDQALALLEPVFPHGLVCHDAECDCPDDLWESVGLPCPE